MSLRRVTGKPAPSSNPYAFRLGEIEFSDLQRRDGSWLKPSGGVVPALWLGRKNGQTTVSLGTLSIFSESWSNPLSYDDSPEELLAKADMRYGGSWRQKLVGDTLWMNPNHMLSVEDQIEVTAYLRSVLDDPESLPEGWTGWFRK